VIEIETTLATNLAPSVASNQLRSRLRAAREKLGLKQEDVAQGMRWSTSKVMRIESGQSPIQIDDFEPLLKLYEINDRKEVVRLAGLARASRRPSLAKNYRQAVSPALAELYEHEPYAAVIKQFETKYIPGMLQSREYAYPLLHELTGRSIYDDVLGLKVDLRRDRAERLLGPTGPEIQFVVDESVLRRAVGSESSSPGDPNYATMIQMLEALKAFNTVGREARGETISPTENPRVSVQIAPFSIGMYEALRGAFTMLEFPQDQKLPDLDYKLSDLVYFEDRNNEVVIREDEDDKAHEKIQKYRSRFDALLHRSPGPQWTNGIVDEVIRMMESKSNSGIERISWEP
jgi:transcriptional regulator with XRE-family HTH domain